MSAWCAYGSRGYFLDLGASSSGEGSVGFGGRPGPGQLARALSRQFDGADVVAGQGNLAVFLDAPTPELDRLLSLGRAELLSQTELRAPAGDTTIEHRLRVVYDGPDLLDVAERTGLTPEEVASAHSSRSYDVELVGFLPGFGYLSALVPELRLPRRSEPRPRVAADSLAIAAEFTGVYPFDSPGGWHLLGRALDAALFDAGRDSPVRLQAGDRVVFEEVRAADAGPPAPRLRPARDRSAIDAASSRLVVGRAEGVVTVQDLGRAGRLGHGLPPSGALSPRLLRRANRAVGNEDGAAALEIFLGSVELHSRGTCVISVDGERAVRLCDGERWVVPAGARAVRYLAVAGGLDVPVLAGSRSTLAVARFGGFEGRGLRHGDELGVAPAANSGGGPTNLAVERAEAPSIVDDEALVLSPGPHAGQVPGAFEHLLATQWRVSPWVDRVGMRLEGERRASTTSVRPTALTRGAVQWTPDGTPIVLGPDHPITGGYPIVAVVEPESLSALAERRPGEPLRWTRAR